MQNAENRQIGEKIAIYVQYTSAQNEYLKTMHRLEDQRAQILATKNMDMSQIRKSIATAQQEYEEAIAKEEELKVIIKEYHEKSGSMTEMNDLLAQLASKESELLAKQSQLKSVQDQNNAKRDVLLSRISELEDHLRQDDSQRTFTHPASSWLMHNIHRQVASEHHRAAPRVNQGLCPGPTIEFDLPYCDGSSRWHQHSTCQALSRRARGEERGVLLQLRQGFSPDIHPGRGLCRGLGVYPVGVGRVQQLCLQLRHFGEWQDLFASWREY